MRSPGFSATQAAELQLLVALRCRSSKEIACLVISLQQGFDTEAELDVSLASLA